MDEDRERTPPWRSQKIWAMVIGVALVATLFAFDRPVEACALAAMVGAFVLGRGLERLGVGLLLLVALSSSACGAPWAIARGTVSAADAAIDQVELLIPEDAEGREEALASTRAALELGELAADVWEREATTEAPTGWAKWVGDALSGLATVLDLLKSLGVPIPPAVTMAVAGVAALLPALGGG